jgi:hypothetical protein
MPHPPLITVNVGNAGWEQRVRQAIESNNFIKVIITGAKASQLQNELRRKGIYVPRTGAGAIVAGAVLISCVSVVGLAALSVVLIYAIQRGYNSISAIFRDRSGQNNDEFIIELK